MTNEEKIRAIWKSASFCASPCDRGFANKLMCEKLGHSESIPEMEPFWLMLYPLGMRQQILLEELERLMEIEKKGYEDFIIYLLDRGYFTLEGNRYEDL